MSLSLSPLGFRPGNTRWLLLTAWLLLGGCKPQVPAYSARFQAFGTTIDITITGATEDLAESASLAVEQDFADFEQAWRAGEDGPLTRLNRQLATGQTFAADPALLPLILWGQRLATQSGDLLNPAQGRLTSLWGFQTGMAPPSRPPATAAIQALVKANPRMADIQLDDISLQCRNPQLQLELSGFAKGYAVDLAIAHLQELGIHHAIVSAGGDLRAIGSRSGRPWRIAIRGASRGGVLGFVAIQGNESLFTATSDKQSFTHQGKTYHALLDPRTGYPADKMRSVTVLHPDAVIADAAATALFIAGPEHWHAVASRMGIRFVLLVDANNQVHMNPEMAKRVSLLDETIHPQLSPPL